MPVSDDRVARELRQTYNRLQDRGANEEQIEQINRLRHLYRRRASRTRDLRAMLGNNDVPEDMLDEIIERIRIEEEDQMNLFNEEVISVEEGDENSFLLISREDLPEQVVERLEQIDHVHNIQIVVVDDVSEHLTASRNSSDSHYNFAYSSHDHDSEPSIAEQIASSTSTETSSSYEDAINHTTTL